MDVPDNHGMVIITFLFAMAASPGQATCTPQFAPLNTGSHSGASTLPFWRKEEAGRWDGGGWLGWSWKSDALVPTTLTVRDRQKDQPDDADEVTVETVPGVTFAARCVNGLRAGAIRPAGVVNHELNVGGPLRISVGERRYELRLRSPRGDLSDATVTLTEGRRTQTLYSAGGFADDPHFHVVWAGDLDRDGRLDLVVNFSNKYSLSPYRLLLSSRASGTLLVGEAANFETGD